MNGTKTRYDASNFTKVVLEVSITAGVTRINISALDDEGSGHGYRIYGPKFGGADIKPVVQHELSIRDAEEIRDYLDIIPQLKQHTEQDQR